MNISGCLSVFPQKRNRVVARARGLGVDKKTGRPLSAGDRLDYDLRWMC
jgi:hypothetical protein